MNAVLTPTAALAAVQGFAPHRAQLRQDSRLVRAGDVFVAHSGAAHDGRAFILAAFTSGASCVLADAADFASSDARVILVHDLKAVLGTIASGFYGAPSADLHCVAYTGTNGKTTCSGWAAFLAGQRASYRADHPASWRRAAHFG
jgi:UDP-N-acetylmuramyl tripeptide synthase